MQFRSVINDESVLSPCYCNQCKRSLTSDRVMDNDFAWCPNCKSIVGTASMQIPAWTVGTTALLFLVFFLTHGNHCS